MQISRPLGLTSGELGVQGGCWCVGRDCFIQLGHVQRDGPTRHCTCHATTASMSERNANSDQSTACATTQDPAKALLHPQTKTCHSHKVQHLFSTKATKYCTCHAGAKVETTEVHKQTHWKHKMLHLLRKSKVCKLRVTSERKVQSQARYRLVKTGCKFAPSKRTFNLKQP